MYISHKIKKTKRGEKYDLVVAKTEEVVVE